MMKLCLFIPTMNRSECVRDCLTNLSNSKLGKYIHIYIYDTSNDNKTEDIVNLFGDINIQYKHNRNYSDKTTDLKIVETFPLLKNDFDYIWLCGDGLLLKFDYLESTLNSLIKARTTIIQFMPKEYSTGGNKFEIIQNIPLSKYFQKCGWYATYYGSTIISTKLIDIHNLDSIYKKMNNTGFLYWSYLYNQLALTETPRISIIYDNYYDTSKHKTSNTSYKPKRFLKFWANNWIQAVGFLPEYYDPYKEIVIKSVGNELGLYRIRNLIILRSGDNLDRELYNEYKNRLKLVTDKSLTIIRLVAYTPKWIASCLNKFLDVLSYFKHKLIRR